MTENNPPVLHLESGLVLNVTLPDCGHPELPDVWERLREKSISTGVLQCVLCKEEDREQWMYLREDRLGRREAVHFERVPAHRTTATSPESDDHKLMKEFAVGVLEREGFNVQVEARSGKRVISDVEVTGGAVDLSVEVELKQGTAEAVMARSRRREGRGLQPFWWSDQPDARYMYRVPSAAISPASEWRTVADLDTRVVRGVRTAETFRCGRDGARSCPRTGGPLCGRLHVRLAPAQGAHIDKLLVGAAAGTYRSLQIKKDRRTYCYWVPEEDHRRYTCDRGSEGVEMTSEVRDDLRKFERSARDLSTTCTRTVRRPSNVIPDRMTALPYSTDIPYRVPPRSLEALEWKIRMDGDCLECGEPARRYPTGWHCDDHVPGSPSW